MGIGGISAQEITVSGTVVDEGGIPVPGVSVVVKNTARGVATDFEGKYTINVNNNDMLEFSSVGFQSFSQKVAGSGKHLTINVILKEEAQELDQVVVVGYKVMKKSDVTASVATVESKDLNRVAAPNVSTLLQGKASGVQIVQSTGRPGANSDVRIRGVASTGGNTSPLWVVDGVIMHGTPNINPHEIESVSVLKDASATALYGSRGANGVIQVTTRSGQRGVTSVSISTRTGFSDFSMGNFKLMNSQQLYDYYQMFDNPDRIPSGITADVTANDFNWLKNGTQTGITQDHNITLTGGGEKSRTFFTLGYYNETGSVKGYEYDRVSFRLNHDYNVSEKFILKPKISANYNKYSDRQHSLYDMYLNMPWDNPYNSDGSLINPQASGFSGKWYGRDNRNYLYNLQYNYGKSNEFNLMGNFDFEFSILPKLKFISTNSTTLYYSDGLTYVDPKSTAGVATRGQLSKSNAKRYTNLTNQTLKYSDVFGAHSLNAQLAYEFNNYKYQDDSATGEGIVAGSQILGNTSKPRTIGGTANDYALQSLFLTADYAYGGKYVVEGSVRRDGASNFGLNTKYGMFYSGSVAWNVHEEAFFKNDIVNVLKLRASYGSLGNRPSSLYPQYELYGLGYTYNAAPAIVPSQLGNEDLEWEKSYQTNFGLDVRVFDRLSLTLEYYIKNTSDLLYFVTLPATVGYTGYWENIGGIRNKGFEANFSWDAFRKENGFNLTVGGNIGVNRNEITEVYNDNSVIRSTKITKVGEDFNSWYMRKWAGVDPATGNPLWEVVNPTTGEISTTTNYNQATLQIVGTSSPDFFGGFFLNGSYKQFNFGADFTFSKGGLVYNASRELFDSDGAYPTYNQMLLADGWSRWQQAGDVATHPRALYGGNNNSNKTSSRYLEDGSYLRLRNVRVGYTLPEGVTQKLRMKMFEIYASFDNLWITTKYSGTDPEGGIDGVISSQYPISKKMSIGLNLTF